MALRFDTAEESVTKIKVIGVGGGGNNTIDRMVKSNLQGAEFIAVNTDLQQLNRSLAPVKLQIGQHISDGKGCGADPLKGRRCAEESREELRALLQDTDLLFVTAGMGGGTGTGAAAVIAELAKELGILTIGVVTRPFKFEGAKRASRAEAGIHDLYEHVDSLLVIPNERLKYVTDQKITFVNAFAFADEILKQAISSIYELITVQGLISLDFADVETVMQKSGFAHMGVGKAAGKNKAIEAARMAVQSPLMETSISGAKGVLLNIIASPEIELNEIDTAASFVQENAHPEAVIIFGAAIDDSLSDEVRISIIATGFTDSAANPLPSQGTDAAEAAKPAPTVEKEPENDSLADEYERLLKLFQSK
ncbi:MAG TPA: cell division protein FtsZ [Clostridiales bacterium]|jgi:cell division protein FtsZ|nr:cell division protein FtsZ [Clostridiales bacterium]